MIPVPMEPRPYDGRDRTPGGETAGDNRTGRQNYDHRRYHSLAELGFSSAPELARRANLSTVTYNDNGTKRRDV